MQPPTTAPSGATTTDVPQAEPVPWLLMAGLFSGGAVVVLDFFIVLACLPSIGTALGASASQLQLVMAVYAIANGSLLVVGGRLGDVRGRGRVFRWGLLGFALASAACGLAGSALALILLRVLQGACGAFLQPQVLGLIALNTRQPQRPRVFGLYAATLGCAGIAAQLVGGLLVGLLPVDLGWRACFFLSVPLCLVSGLLAATARAGPRVEGGGIDLVGALLLGLALACLGAVLTLGREQAWPAWIMGVGVLSAVCLAGFVLWQRMGARRGLARLVPAGMLSSRGFGLALLMILVFFSGVASMYFILALELRRAVGFSPIQVGALFGWLGCWFVIGSSSRRLRRRLGPATAQAGVVSLLLGHALMTAAALDWMPGVRVPAFLVSSLLQGLGVGLLMGHLMANALARVAPEQASVGGGLAAATQQIGNSMGICLIGLAYFGPGIQPDGPALHSVAAAALYLAATLLVLQALLRRSQ